MPPLKSTFIQTPATSNPLGTKGASESGTIGAPAAIGNAVVDALWHLGVRHIALPLTSEKVWRAMAHARAETIAVTPAILPIQPPGRSSHARRDF
jgi:carbon-monoxide dehydrogenase large subunit